MVCLTPLTRSNWGANALIVSLDEGGSYTSFTKQISHYSCLLFPFVISFSPFPFPFKLSFFEKRGEIRSKEEKEPVKCLIISQVSVDLDF